MKMETPVSTRNFNPNISKISKALVLFLIALDFSFLTPFVQARQSSVPFLSAASAVIINAKNGNILYGKNPHLKLPPASTTKLMTALLVIEKLPLNSKTSVSRAAVNVSPSKAGLTLGADYRVIDLLVATLVSSSNDAAVALAEAVAGNEKDFVVLMNQKAQKLGMKNTHFVNATGLTEKGKKQYSTAYDLAKLMQVASENKLIDQIMGIMTHQIRGSDNKIISIRSHNKMLWRAPQSIKGKTGWTFASRHTFVGTDYSAKKSVMFAMLKSKEPWTDIQKLATLGNSLKKN